MRNKFVRVSCVFSWLWIASAFQGGSVDHRLRPWCRNLTTELEKTTVLSSTKAADEIVVAAVSKTKKSKPKVKSTNKTSTTNATASTKKVKGSITKKKDPAAKNKKKKKKVKKKIVHWIDDSDSASIDVGSSNGAPSPLQVNFKVHGNPLPLRRHRTSGGFMYNPSAPAQASFQNATLTILNSLPQEWTNDTTRTNETSLPFFSEGQPVAISIRFRMKRPNAHFIGGKPGPGRMRETAPPAISGQLRTDVDNLAKFVLDSMNGILYQDDKQVCSLHVVKLLDDDGDCQGSTQVSCRLLNEGGVPALTNDLFGSS